MPDQAAEQRAALPGEQPVAEVVLAAEQAAVREARPLGIRPRAPVLVAQLAAGPPEVCRPAAGQQVVKAVRLLEVCQAQVLAAARAERREVYLPAPELAVARVEERVNRELERLRVRRATKLSRLRSCLQVKFCRTVPWLLQTQVAGRYNRNAMELSFKRPLTVLS